MQKNLVLKTTDKNFRIYGVLDALPRSSKLIIFVHGLTGHKNEHHFYNAAKFFNQKGFDTFRFDLYSGEAKGRRLERCSIITHSLDVGAVIRYFAKKYKNIYLVGHSLGGPSILGADLSGVKKIVLWDPSCSSDEESQESWCVYDKKIGAYRVDWGVTYLMSKEMVDDWRNLDSEKWYKNCIVPLKVVAAGKGFLKKEWKKLIHGFSAKHELVVISGAGHCFDEGDTEQSLFRETLTWFKK